MKKYFIIIFTMLLIGMVNNLNAQQMFGKWVVPTDSFPARITHELTFSENGISSQPLPLTSYSDQIEFSAGGYNDNYDLKFYELGDIFCYGTTTFNWVNETDPNLQPEFQIIQKPDDSEKYYSFFSGEINSRKELKTSFFYNEITIDGNTIQNSDHIKIREIGSGYIAFAITPEDVSPRYIYASTGTATDTPWQHHIAAIRKWEITNTGIDVYNYEIILSQDDSGFDEYDFDAYNLELKIDNNNKTVIAYIHGTKFETHNQIVTELIVVIDGDGEKYELNSGRLAGIEFSTLEENIIYVSSKEGLLKVNYTNGDVVQTLDNNDFQRTFLQTGPDGHIYGVSNSGNTLGQINMETGTFSDNSFSFPENHQIITTKTFYDTTYYILPENSNTYQALSVYDTITDESCPDEYDGEIKIYVTGGVPFSPPDDPYNIECEGVDFSWNEDEAYFEAINLTKGYYDYTITDNAQPIANIIQGQFFIDVDNSGYSHIGEDIEISGTQEWSNYNESYLHGFTIKSGTILTIINSTIQFGPDANIIIEQGAKLILNNTTLSDYTPCNDKWQGIQVWGVEGQHQYSLPGNPCAQGSLIITDSSVIENAVSAVELWNPGESSSTGGIVQARDSYFINNAKSIHANNYTNYNPSIPSQEMNNVSYFKNCTFDVNNNYIVDQYLFKKHADLAYVKGFNFEGCDFSLSDTEGISDYNCGISALDAGFSVTPICLTNTIPCDSYDKSNFNGFYNGIRATSGGKSNNTFSVFTSTFSNNSTGIYVSSVNNAVVVDCDFEIGYNTVSKELCDDNSYSYGIDVHTSIGFAIEENEFTKYAGSLAGYYFGIRVYECPSISDDIYLNKFIGLSVGNQAELSNRSIWDDDITGVAYICNWNIVNDYDFYVADNSKIRGGMGSDVIPSGNILSDLDITVVQFQNDYTENIEYYYNQNKPDEIITEYSDYITPYPVNAENTCPSHYGSGGDIKLSGSERLIKEQDYFQNLSDFNGVEVLFENLEDGGNTDAELLDIQTAQPDDMWALRAQLLGDSPHLSRDVLLETADKTDVFPESAIFDIMAANPDELRKDTLINYLENKEEPLPAYMIETLRQLADGLSYKTVLLNQMSAYHSEKIKAAQDIIRSTLNDSIINMYDLRNWLDNIGELVTDKQIISSYLHEGDTTNALTLLNMLPALYELQDEELDAYFDYSGMVNLHITLQSQGRNITQLDSTEIAGLLCLADSASGDVRMHARNILEFAYGYHYCDCPSLPDSIALKSSSLNYENLIKSKGMEIVATPNPASTWVAFDYRLALPDTEAAIRIFDISGRIVETFKVVENKGQKVWDIRHIKPGVYIYTLNTGEYSKSGKLIIR